MKAQSDLIKYAIYEVFTDPDVLTLLTKKLIPYLKEDDPSIPNPPKRATSNLSIKARFISAFEDLRYNRKPTITTYATLSEVGLMRVILNDVNLWRKSLNSVMYLRTIRRRFVGAPIKFNEHEGISEKMLELVKLLDKYQHNVSADANTTTHVLELDEMMKSLYLQTMDFYLVCRSRDPDFKLRNPPTESVHSLLAKPEAPAEDTALQHSAMREKTPEEKERARRRAIRLGLLPKEEETQSNENAGDWSGDPERPLPKVQPIPGL